MSVKSNTEKSIIVSSWINNLDHNKHNKKFIQFTVPQVKKIDILLPLRNWLNNLEIHDPSFAHKLCKLIPTQCPFARTVKIFNIKLFTIPPLCKLNPLYDEVIGLRFRALCYLADQCGEDISSYC